MKKIEKFPLALSVLTTLLVLIFVLIFAILPREKMDVESAQVYAQEILMSVYSNTAITDSINKFSPMNNTGYQLPSLLSEPINLTVASVEKGLIGGLDEKPTYEITGSFSCQSSDHVGEYKIVTLYNKPTDQWEIYSLEIVDCENQGNY